MTEQELDELTAWIADEETSRDEIWEKAMVLIAEVRALRKALRQFANELDGMRAFEPEVVAVISRTNWNVLRLRIDEARAALGETL